MITGVYMRFITLMNAYFLADIQSCTERHFIPFYTYKG